MKRFGFSSRESLVSRRISGAVAASIVAGIFFGITPSAQAAGETTTVWTYPVAESVVKQVDAARERAHQALVDLPLWNATIFGPFPAAAITTESNEITFVHINLPSVHAKKTATVKMGVLQGSAWVNTALGTVRLNAYGNGTYKTAIQMPTGTRAQIYVGGKLVTTTIRP